MTTDNIFAAPQAEVQDLAGGGGVLSEVMINSLRQTRPWVLLMAILGFASAVLLGIIAIPMLIGTQFVSMSDGLPAGMLIGMGIFYLVLAGITLLASLHLLKFASTIKQVLESMNPDDLDEVMSAQAKFWRLVGVLSLISIVLVIVLIAVVIFFALSQGMGR